MHAILIFGKFNEEVPNYHLQFGLVRVYCMYCSISRVEDHNA